MIPTSTIALDPGIFERNLTALREFQPELAAQLVQAPHWNQTYQAASTRDGQVNLREEGGRWFGRTSIPRVRAEALLQQFQSGSANVLLPGIGEGTETELLLQRLGRHRAIFIWEPDPSAVHLAFCLHDFSRAIRDQRLIVLVCALDQLSQALSSWLDEHVGHLSPDRILMWPWQTLAELVPCRTSLESTYHAVEQRRKRQFHQPSSPRPSVAGNNVGIVALHAREEVWGLADALSASATELGWKPVACDVRTPADVHPLARARRLAGMGWPDWAILLDVTRRDVADLLPETIPAVSWFSPRTAFDHVGPGDRIAVSSPWSFERATASAARAPRSAVCMPNCRCTGGSSTPAARSSSPRLPCCLRRWAQQALGLSGHVLGFTPLLAPLVRKQAATALTAWRRREQQE
jgi:hypothetical protein